MSDTDRVPPLNLTRGELELLRAMVDDYAVSGFEDDDWGSFREKIERIHRSVETETEQNGGASQ
jgi:hypothetical protein